MNITRIRKYTWLNYMDVLKPRETALLSIIGACTGIVAAAPIIPVQNLLLMVCAITAGSAGCNGLTNYLDRAVDSRMERTRQRVLPLKLIYPARRILPIVITLILCGLALAWILNPVCMIIGVIGVLASALWRKTATCTFFGIIAGCCPVLIGWFALNHAFSIEIVLICVMVAIWIPIHIWSVMIAKKDDYHSAGLYYFPLSLEVKIIVRIMLILGCLLYGISLMLYLMNYFKILYFMVTNVLGLTMITALGYLTHNGSSGVAWRLYKLSSFPYLGILFLTMAIDAMFF